MTAIQIILRRHPGKGWSTEIAGRVFGPHATQRDALEDAADRISGVAPFLRALERGA